MRRYSHFGDMTEDIDGEWIRYADYVEAMKLAWNGGQSFQRALDNLEAMKRISGDSVAPEGWQLVPVDPTESMRLAPAKDRPGFSRNVAAEIYRAMLVAAPQPSPKQPTRQKYQD